MKKTCTATGVEFELTEDDLKFYEKMGVPTPSLCPDERQRRRLSWRNERSIYRRKCDKCKNLIISVYNSGAKFPVYCNKCWHEDEWEAKSFSQDFDFSKPFFEQFKELMTKVPRFALSQSNNENCNFTNFCYDSKNCYLSQRVGNCEDVLYSYLPIINRDIVDCYNITNSELCYELTDARQCYNCCFGEHVENCRDSKFLFNCRGCQDCFFCANLRGKQYYFCNEKLSKTDYQQKIKEFINLSFSQKQKLWSSFLQLKSQQIVPHMTANKVENVTGDYLMESKNVFESFDCTKCEDLKYSQGPFDVHSSFDTTCTWKCKQLYEVIAGIKSENCLFCFNPLNSSFDLFYSIECLNNSNNCFGCISLKHSQYCVLNKQYSKKEYFKLRNKIIEHMKKTGEWGEFFPIEISPFGYNETVAQEYFSLTKEEVVAKGWSWKDEETTTKYNGPPIQIPDSIKDVDDSICEKILTCETTGKNYRIQKEELKFYKKMNLPIPRLCPDERHRKRMELRNARVLHNRLCDKCGIEIQTTFLPDRPEKVFCEKCYLNEIN